MSPDRVQVRYSPSSYIGVRKPMSVVFLVKAERALRNCRRSDAPRHLKNLRPTGDQRVEAEGVLRPTVALSDSEQKVGEFLHQVRVHGAVWPRERCQQEVACWRNTVPLQDLDEMVERFPVARVGVLKDVVVPGQVRRLDELHAASTAGENLVAIHRVDTGVAGAREIVSVAELPNSVTVLSIPGNCEPRRRVEVTFLFVEDLVQYFVYSRQRRPHRHLRAIWFKHRRVTAVYGHPWSDCGLRQIDRRDLTLLQSTQGLRQLRFKVGNKTSAISSRRPIRAGAQRQHDRRREC